MPGRKGQEFGGAALGGGMANSWVNGHTVHVRSRRIRCGKRCGTCPHGPYLYEVWRDDDGKIHERYIGKGSNFS